MGKRKRGWNFRGYVGVVGSQTSADLRWQHRMYHLWHNRDVNRFIKSSLASSFWVFHFGPCYVYNLFIFVQTATCHTPILEVSIKPALFSLKWSRCLRANFTRRCPPVFDSGTLWLTQPDSAAQLEFLIYILRKKETETPDMKINKHLIKKMSSTTGPALYMNRKSFI